MVTHVQNLLVWQDVVVISFTTLPGDFGLFSYPLAGQQWATSLLYKHFGPLMPLDLINYADGIVPFINHMRSIPSSRTGSVRSQASINRYCCFLRTIFNFAVANGLMAQNPMTQWRKTKEPPRQFQISLEDVSKIMEHADAHVRWAIEVCFNLGVRSGDSEDNVRYFSHIEKIEVARQVG